MRKQDIKPGLIVAHSTGRGLSYNGYYAKVLSFDTHERTYEHGDRPRHVVKRVKSPTGKALLLGYHVTFSDHYRPDRGARLPEVPEYTVEDFDNGVAPPAGWVMVVSSTRDIQLWDPVIAEAREVFLAQQEKDRLADAAFRLRRDYAKGLERRATTLGLDIRVSDAETTRWCSNVTMTREQLDSILTELEAHRAER